MSIRSAVLFLPDGKGSPLFLAQWRKRIPAAAIQATAALAENGTATRYFRATWKAAFPTRFPLPDGPIANPDGTGTDAFWTVFS